MTSQLPAREAAPIRDAEHGDAWFVSAFGLSSIGVALISPDGWWLRVNRALCALLGYAEQELVGLTSPSTSHPYWEKSLELARRVSDGERDALTAEERYAHKHGHPIWILLSVSPVRGTHGASEYFIVQFQDITRYKQPPAMTDQAAESKLGPLAPEQDRGFLESIINALPQALFVKDARHRLLHVNDAFCRLRGVARSEMLGKDDHEYLPRELATSRFTEDDRVLASGEPMVTEDPTPLADGRCLWFLRTKIRVAFPDGDKGIIGLFADITAQKQAEEQLARSRSFLDALVNAVPVPVFVKDDEHRWVVMNHAICAFLGMQREALIGRTDFDVFPEEQAARFWKQDEDVMTTDAPVEYEEPYSMPSGENRWVLKHKRRVVLEDGSRYLIGTITDITERRHAAMEVERNRAFLEALVNALPNPLFVKDVDHRWVLMNDAFCRLLGHSREELLGKTDADVLDAATARAAYDEDDAVLGRGETLFFEQLISRPDGEALWGLKSKRSITLPDGKRLVVSQVTDISQLKLAEQALRLGNEDLQRINQELHQTQDQLLQSEKMASIGQLAAGVAHEINNPIGFVYSNLGSLKRYLDDIFSLLDAYEALERQPGTEAMERVRLVREQIDPEFLRADILQLMHESRDGITRVTNIVQGLKDFSHQSAGEQWQWAMLHHGLESTLNIVNNEIKYKANVVREYGEIPEIRCLPSQLNQVFMNLLVNAAHAIDTRGTITLRTGQNGQEVWVEVSDTGCGISPENLNRIYDPFFTTKPVGKGTGLGLALSYGILQTHHGRIEVESEVGRGTTFRLWLPIRQQESL